MDGWGLIGRWGEMCRWGRNESDFLMIRLKLVVGNHAWVTLEITVPRKELYTRHFNSICANSNFVDSKLFVGNDNKFLATLYYSVCSEIWEVHH